MAHDPAGHFHHGGNFGAYVYPDDYFNDCDPDHGGTAKYEHDHADVGRVHVGTYNLTSEHDRAVFLATLAKLNRPLVYKHSRRHPGYGKYAVVHRRVSSDR